MNKKIVSLFLTLLVSTMSASSVAMIFNDNKIIVFYSSDCPDDFELLIDCGGFAPWTELYSVHIKSNGETFYLTVYPENRSTGEWTLISKFNFTDDELDLIWSTIEMNDFFSLNDIYTRSSISGGTFANLTITGNGITHSVQTENIDVSQFDGIIKIINSLTPEGYDLFYNALYNNPPDNPSNLSGALSGKVGTEYTYTTVTYDIDGDQIYYFFDWGDDTDSGWIGPYEPGNNVTAQHTWSKKGNYDVRVKSIDDPNGDGDLSDGMESDWSNPISVNMPKYKQTINMPLVLFLEKHKEKFPIFKYFLAIINTPRFSSITFDDEDKSGTRAKYEKCVITIEIYMIIYGPWVKENELDNVRRFCQAIMTAIESRWNKDQWADGDGEPWYVDCEPICHVHKPGCEVKFDANVTYQKKRFGLIDGYHMIYIPNWKPVRNFVLGKDNQFPKPNDGTEASGQFEADTVPGMFAHEAGHLMGLKDQYVESSTVSYNPERGWYTERLTYPIPGEEGNIMAQTDGKPDQDDIDDIVKSSGIKCPCECCPCNDTEEPYNEITWPHEIGHVFNSTVKVQGEASDYGSGVAKLDYQLDWDGGTYDGEEYIIDPPKNYFEYELGPINLENYIEPDDWIKITTYAIDAAGNIGEDSVTVTWMEEEDTTPPVTEKTIGEPQWEEGYTIASFTSILLEATDPEPGSGVNHIHYEIWQEGILMGSEDVPGDTVEMTFGMHGVVYGIAELRWYAEDYAENSEQMHYQEHFILY